MQAKLLCALLFAVISVGAHAKDHAVNVLPDVEGKLHVPANVDTPDRVVVFLHGWNGDMDEVGNLFGDLADALGDRGIASLRINFTGEGVRSGNVLSSTLDSRVSESEAAFAFVNSKYPKAKKGLLGFSLGGLTAMTIVSAHPDWFQAMVIWSGAEAMRPEGDPVYAAAAQKAMREGSAIYKTWADLTLTREHLGSFVGVNASLHLNQYPGAFLSIRGDHDYVPANDRKWLGMLPTDNKSFVLIGGADHIFNVLEQPRPDYGRRVIQISADWFDETL